jgi:CRP-like cAMP-binding protein
MGVEGLLSQIPFLRTVPPERLAKVATESFQKRYRPGERVVVQGEYGHTMFVVLRGGLRVVLERDDGTQLEVARLDRPGQFFGEMALLSQARRTATVVADADSVLLEIEKQRIDALSKEHKEVQGALEALYQKRVISSYINQCGHFVDLPPSVVDEVVERSSLRTLGRDDHVYAAGDANDALYLVKDGHLKMHRPGAAGGHLNVLGYFNAGDFFGVPDEGKERQATVTALGKVEIIRIPADVVHKLNASSVIRERLRKVVFARKEALLRVLGAGHTVAFAAQQMMLDGQVEAASLLIIDLERCVRCGNCSASCHDRHGASRLARRGKKIRRRAGGFEEGRHQHVLIPSSCYHCANPECMVGCPTGAIHREKDGEVNIYDFCIGCTNCARRCPYDNITMADRPDAGAVDAAGKKKSPTIATKCSLCKGYDDAACVTNCPTGAILRVDPKLYFEEVAALRDDGSRAGGKVGKGTGKVAAARHTIGAAGYRRSALPVTLIGAFFALCLLAAYVIGGRPRGPSTSAGLGLGLFAAAACLGAVALAVKRRTRKVVLGTIQRWTQVHIALGGLGFFAALLHANFRLHGLVSGLLLVTFGLVFATGLLGVWLYRRVPPILARVEGERALLVEDVENERGQLVDEIDALCEAAPELHEVAATARRLAGGVGLRSRDDYTPERHADTVQTHGKIEHLVAGLPHERRAEARRVARDVVRLVDCEVQLRLYRSLRVWLALHIASTALTLVLLAAHVAAALWWWA